MNLDLYPFSFNRTKGIVWVCDLAKSSSYLNSDEGADDIESYIPRLYYVAKRIVECYGGIFLKWTGDGFLAFFEIELDRHKTEKASQVYEAAWQLTFMSNITQFGLEPKRKFKIRHGITYEKDALLMHIKTIVDQPSLDIIGRSVVLAFRLSGIECEFPGIVTVRELLKPNDPEFLKWKPDAQGKLKFFKGEKFGTDSIYVSAKKKSRTKTSMTGAVKQAKDAIATAETGPGPGEDSPIYKFYIALSQGPEWCQHFIKTHLDFLKTKLLGTLKELVTHIPEIEKASKNIHSKT